MKPKLNIKDYIYSQLLHLCVRLGAVILLYSIFRLLFYLFYLNSFPNVFFSIFLYGIKFDLCAIFTTNFPYIVAALLPFTFYYTKVYRIILDTYFILINIFAAIVSFFDMAYFPYVLKRTTFDIFQYLQIGFDWQTLLPSFFKQFWYLFLLLFITIFVIIYIVKFANKCFINKPVFQKFRWTDFLCKSIIFFVFIFISIVCIRGGIQTRPLGIMDTGKDASIQNAALVSNTPFTMIKSFGKQNFNIEKKYFKDLEETEKYFSPIISSITPYSPFNYPVKNVVVIILEGFSQYLLKGMETDTTNIYQGYAPFLYELQKQSLSFNGIANGHRTIDALQAIFAGMPKLLDKSTDETHFANNLTSSPVEVLKKNGFNTLFFHGAKNGSMNIESYCYSVGFNTYYGKNEYPNPSDYDGVWGISDRSFLKFVAQKLNSVPQPFFASVLTLSSHHPFVIPKDAKGLDIKYGKNPIHTLASYTDHAVREFFETLSQYSWYKNTLFIITGDHIGDGSIPKTNSIYTTFQIPIFFYHPTTNINIKMGNMQQLDIMPSLFSYLQMDKPLFSYGNNVFDSTYTSYSANYIWGIYQIISEDFILQFDGEKSIGLYEVKKDFLMQNNLINDMPEVADFYEQKLKAIIQSYTTRLVKNQLFINR